MGAIGLSRPLVRNLVHCLGWTRHSFYLLGGFLLTIVLIVYLWWPLARVYLNGMDRRGQWWHNVDWLLVGIFTAMALLIMVRANLRVDGLIVLVALFGGLAIESWGTQTNLWFYYTSRPILFAGALDLESWGVKPDLWLRYTSERPPLWIIPAWPVATLSTNRLARFLGHLLPGEADRVYRKLYWVALLGFYGLMLSFVAPTLGKSYTVGALAISALVILTTTDYRLALFTFVAGAGLGYFLELWGTTRGCWTYYSYERPPLFAVLAHGMASVTFWRIGLLAQAAWARLRERTGASA